MQAENDADAATERLITSQITCDQPLQSNNAANLGCMADYQAKDHVTKSKTTSAGFARAIQPP